MDISKHTSLCWDLDGTLFDHPDTEQFAEFIRTNPFNQVFHIVTFRTHRLVTDIVPDLEDIGLNPMMFKTINHPTNAEYAQYYLAMKRGTEGMDHPAIVFWQNFKGATCARLRSNLLIDDMRDDVLPGCRTFGIEYIHPDDFAVHLPTVE